MNSTDKTVSENQKFNIRILIRAVAFILVFAICFCMLSNILVRKDSNAKYKSFFDEKNEFDVLFTGISHMEFALYPLDIWNDYGFTSFNIGESGSILPVDYWVLKNALDYKTPKLVVIDVRRSDWEMKKLSSGVGISQFDRYPLSINKIKTAEYLYSDPLEKDEKIEFLFPLIKYHDRWQELTENDFAENDFRIKGSFYPDADRLTAIVPELYDRVPETEKKYGSDIALGALRGMIEMCQEKGIDVLLTELPYNADPDCQMLANGIRDIADEYGVGYIDFLQCDEFMNYHTDMLDHGGHVNDSGARKITAAMGQYIVDNYDMPDHRGDARYDSWNKEYEDYLVFKNNRIAEQNRLDDELIVASDKNVDSVILVKSKAGEYVDFRMRELLNNVVRFDTDITICPEGETGDMLYIVRNSDKTVEAIDVTGESELNFNLNGKYFKINLEGSDGITVFSEDNEVMHVSHEADAVTLAYNSVNDTLADVSAYSISDNGDVVWEKIYEE